MERFPLINLSWKVVLISLIYICNSPAQDLVKDTLIISFQNDSLSKIKGIVDIQDRRADNSSIIGKYEVAKYLFIPVDLMICTKKTLVEEISVNMLDYTEISGSTSYTLTLDEFKLDKKTNGLIYPHYLLHTSIGIYKKNNSDQKEYIGQLSYEIMKRERFFSDKLINGFTNVIQKWQKLFYQDFITVKNAVSTGTLPLVDNLSHKKCGEKVSFLYANLDFAIGSGNKILDGEIYFSHQEVKRMFYRSSYSIRYRKENSFDAMEFALSSDNLFYRLDPILLFRGKSQLLFGINRWNDLNREKRELYDALILDLSLSQLIQYNPVNNTSLIFGLGFMENIYYIYSENVNFQCNILIQLGCKL